MVNVKGATVETALREATAAGVRDAQLEPLRRIAALGPGQAGLGRDQCDGDRTLDLGWGYHVSRTTNLFVYGW